MLLYYISVKVTAVIIRLGCSCCIQGCKSNYSTTDTSTFTFPKDKILIVESVDAKSKETFYKDIGIKPLPCSVWPLDEPYRIHFSAPKGKKAGPALRIYPGVNF